MKKFSFLLSLLTVLGLYSCSQEDAFLEGTPSQGLTAQIPSYQFDNQTRVNISPNLSTFTWTDGDKIGIYYTSETTYADAKFTLKQGGSSHGEFYNEAFSLKPNATYYAFYPYDSDATVDSYPVDFTGQVQTANGSTAHIGARNYMSSEVNTDANGAANISFQNLAAVIQVAIPIEEVGIYTGVTLSTTADDFITRGTMDMKTGEITPAEKSQQMGLSFGKGLALNEGDVLVANFLVAPTDLSGQYLTILLTERNGATQSATGYGKMIEKGKAYRYESGELNVIPYLTFTAGATQTLSLSKAVETLEYSVNGGDWQELGTNTVTFGGANGNLRLRGKSSKGTANDCKSDYSKIYFGNVTKVACSGDIRTLVDYENYSTADTSNARFCNLFQDCSSLTSAPSLPATTLARYCYTSMFSGCTNLTTAPELPATTLAQQCYEDMFSDCSNLTSAPSLPATTLARSCYDSMFQDCSSLTSAPSLPATTLADYCYRGMFHGCSSLTSAPSLPATTLAYFCYSSMFYGCSSLTSAPSLPATTLASGCYCGMFYGCTSLTSAPSLPATTLARSCYDSMFQDCSSLTSAPSLPATTLADYCYRGMFQYCTSLTSAPSLPATTLAGFCYSGMFYGTNVLPDVSHIDFTVPTAPQGWQGLFAGTKITDEDLKRILPLNNDGNPSLPATTLADYCYYDMFSGCTSLTSAPSLPATTLASNCYCYMFSGCSSLTSAPSLPATTLASSCYSNMFDGCSSLTSAPSLPATTLASYCYSSMFHGCSSLTSAPSLPATTLADYCYDSMFEGCTSLTTAPELPATTLATSCYEHMFYGCSSLTSAPSLPATTLASSCYSRMFFGCSKLNYIKMMATDISALGCLSYWTFGVASTGTFIKSKDATWNVSGSSGIPTGWTVQTE